MLSEVPVAPLAVSELEPVIGPERYTRLLDRGGGVPRRGSAQRAIWTVSSTAVGGGVAEMLQVLVAYAEGLQIPIHWTVIGGDPEFFATTKALHNQIHGQIGSTGMISPAAARTTGRCSPRTRTSCSGRCGPVTWSCCMTRRRRA